MHQPEDILSPENDPLWYKDAIIYEVHVRSYHDSDGDGIGDFRGLARKLDYIQDLGVTAIWLLPFCPSPLRDDGYDIADYGNIHPHYGTLRDFRAFLREAHRRGLRVITELVVNHTSDQHPWFQRARHARPGSRWRDFYVWSETPDRYAETRIIFKDFEASNWSWDPVAQAYYWHRFYAHQPDLNYDSPHVRRAVRQVLDFWFGMGVDSLRLDAVPYLFEREGTNCENLAETHALLKDLRRHLDAKFANRMFLAEANQWPEDAAAYFGDGDECHMNFHFPLMPRLFMALRMEDRHPIIDILDQTPTIPDNCQWALFLRNHDELTLEMVTDEERDYMYRAYARDSQMRINLGIRRRLAPLLGNDRRKIELLNGLLFSMPGTPVIYYGDEIGMGDNFYLGDRNGVRTPMQWNADRNAGFSQANPQSLFLPVIIDPEYHYETVNVETQQNNPNSLLWWMKHLISMRKRYRVFGRGTIEFLQPDNRKVLAFIRRYQEEIVLVVANLSRYTQYAELDLSAFQGMVPLELYGRLRFPPIEDRPYLLTLNPYAFYWMALETPPVEAIPPQQTELVTVTVQGSWDTLVQGRHRAALEALLPAYLRPRRWFIGKVRSIRRVEIRDVIPVPRDTPTAYITMVQVEYTDGDPETYVVPLTFATGELAERLQDAPAAIARLRVQRRSGIQEGLLYDAMSDTDFATTVFGLIAHSRRAGGHARGLVASATRGLRSHLRAAQNLEPSILRAEQNNTSVIYGNEFILKLYRRIEEGVNPDLEIGRYLTEQKPFLHIAPVAGALEFCQRYHEPMTLAMLQRFVPNQGDAWGYTLDHLGHYFEAVIARQAEIGPPSVQPQPLLAQVEEEMPPLADELLGHYLEAVGVIGRHTGELHLTLSQASGDPYLAPEAFTDFYRRGLYQSMIGQANQALRLLRRRLRDLPEAVQSIAQRVLDLQTALRRRFQAVRDRKITAGRIRCHGDYHLGQILYTGRDFVIIDFEGESAKPLSVRRLPRSPLRDVAGMLRSLHYASCAALLGQVASVRPEDAAGLEPWAQYWYAWVATAFLRAYLDVARKGNFLPSNPDHLQILLDAYLLEKALYELSDELNRRPDWAQVPLQGILLLTE
jgi:maltose alpha-D-glucosyltransferase/alpha-amylase